MRWCRYLAGDRTDGSAGYGSAGYGSAGYGVAGYGIVDGDRILAVDGDPFGTYRTTGASIPAQAARLLPPTVPGTFFCVGLNYADHVRQAMRAGHAVAFPERPEVGYRASGALVGSGEPIVKPADADGAFEAEGELVAVIGRALRRCSRDEARAGVLGWTIGNDVSARQWQRTDRTLWRAKNSDTFKPMGPWIDTDAAPLEATTTVSVNGDVRASFATGAMIFDPYDYIVEIAAYITLRPGDVLWMGADGGVGMRPGDVVDVTISGLGTLSNPVVEERPSAAVEEAGNE